MARTRLMVHMTKGDPHLLDFEAQEDADAALAQINEAMDKHQRLQEKPVTIADRLVVRPVDVRLAELVEPPGAPF
jgi:hypothetical protein